MMVDGREWVDVCVYVCVCMTSSPNAPQRVSFNPVKTREISIKSFTFLVFSALRVTNIKFQFHRELYFHFVQNNLSIIVFHCCLS